MYLSPRNSLICTLALLIVCALPFFYWKVSLWPNLFWLVGIPLIFRQISRARLRDGIFSGLVFGLAYILEALPVRWDILLPVLLIMSMVYSLCRECSMTLKERE
ncbi:MAG: hypothetical protein VXZ72_02540 [Chlamydiota bacterium]|nr:hypothetical protein [Chlamydiota bacterium]